MSEMTAKRLFRRYIEIWETGRVEDLAEVIHDDYVGHPSWGDRDGNELRRRIAAFHDTYQDLRFTIEDQLAEGNRVASRMIASATQASDGQKVILYGLNISRISAGRIIEEWMAWEIQPARPHDRPRVTALR